MFLRRAPKVKKNALGVSRIRRDTYNTVTGGMSQKGGWWQISAEVRKRDNNRCVACFQKGIIKAGKEVHHIVPLSRGGTTTKANLITLCEDCHNKRHAHLHKARGR